MKYQNQKRKTGSFHPLEFKPDLADAHRRWEAYWAGELLDRPVVTAWYNAPGTIFQTGSTYYDRANGDMNAIFDRVFRNAQDGEFLAETIPQLWTSFGPDEIAAFCGGNLEWAADRSGDTNWSKPFISDWDRDLPLAIRPDSPLWQRMRTFFRLAAEKLGGRMLLCSPDLHTNMDLLAAVRGPQQLCMDLVDNPSAIDRAMQDAVRVFEEVWTMCRTEGRMDEYGYAALGYSMEGTAVLQCDFSAMIGPEMFRRWVRPALEQEAALVKHAIYHWDGPQALVHFDTLVDIAGLHTLSFVPGTGGKRHIEHLDLFKQVQARGKAVHVCGTVDELKVMHKELDPARVIYQPEVANRKELEDFLRWLTRHT